MAPESKLWAATKAVVGIANRKRNRPVRVMCRATPQRDLDFILRQLDHMLPSINRLARLHFPVAIAEKWIENNVLGC